LAKKSFVIADRSAKVEDDGERAFVLRGIPRSALRWRIMTKKLSMAFRTIAHVCGESKWSVLLSLFHFSKPA
jgi:hypothetical protein